MEGWMDFEGFDVWMYVLIYGWMDGWMLKVLMDGCMYGWMDVEGFDGWMMDFEGMDG